MQTLVFPKENYWHIPSKEECFKLWKKYAMLENVQAHSYRVAQTALALTQNIEKAGFSIDKEEFLAGALLHDIAKSYTIQHGGFHAQLGAALVHMETKNPYLAQSVLYHVWWPWQEGELGLEAQPWRLALLVGFADKLVAHNETVDIETRFRDIFARYGTNDHRRELIQKNYDQVCAYEKVLNKLGVDTKITKEYVDTIII